MKKKFTEMIVGILLVALSFCVAFGETSTRSAYTMVFSSNVLVLPVNDGEATVLPVMVINSSSRAIVPGRIVNCIFQEFWEGELVGFGITQSIDVKEDGYARIPVPVSSLAKFRYASLYIGGDEASVVNIMFWCTNDLSMPASIVPVDVTAQMVLGEVRDFVYQVLNAWGEPIPNVLVSVTWGSAYVTSPQTAVTDSFGEVSFEVTAPSGTIWSTELRVQVEPLRFIQTAMIVAWGTDSPTPPPLPPLPTGEVATIEASNATSYDGSLPVFDLSIGQSFSAIFVAKDSSGNVVSGVSLTSTYPTCVLTTDSNGQATVTLTGASMAGSDEGSIYVTSDTSKTLAYRVVTGGTTPPPSGEAVTIEAVNPDGTASDGRPEFNSPIGGSRPMIFVVKDSSGNPVVGVTVATLFPESEFTTDGNGQVTVPSPVANSSGWDDDKIEVPENGLVFLEFKISYQ